MTTAPQNYEDHDPTATGTFDVPSGSVSLPVLSNGAATLAKELSQGMRSVGQIRQWLKQVLYRHLQKELRENFKQLPENCGYNQATNLKGLGQVHLCQFVENGKPRRMLCDSRMWGGERQARNCPLWAPKRSKADIKKEFHDLVSSGDMGKIAARWPDVAALMWVLGRVDVTADLREVEEEADQELPSPEPEATP